MTPYSIFVIALTIGLIIYYGYLVSKDLHGKENKTQKNVEIFDINDGDDEIVAVSVQEREDGFSVGSGDDEIKVEVTPVNDPESTPPQPEKKSMLCQLDLLAGNLYMTDVQSAGGLNDSEVRELLLSKHPDYIMMKPDMIHSGGGY